MAQTRRQLALMKSPPVLVVASRFANEALWSEVLHLGGYNLLSKPLNMKESFTWRPLPRLLWKSQLGAAAAANAQSA